MLSLKVGTHPLEEFMQLAKSAWPNVKVQLLERLLGHKLNITREIVKTRVAEAITAERRRGRRCAYQCRWAPRPGPCASMTSSP